jgi:SWIM zinc finger
MKFFEEVTAWAEPNAVNHIYYLSDDKSKMVGYIKNGTTSLFKFKRPITISTKGRKFRLVRDGEADSVYFAKVEERTDKGATVIEVSSSDGKSKYFVTVNGSSLSCSCTGFQFRRKCKHVESVKEKIV